MFIQNFIYADINPLSGEMSVKEALESMENQQLNSLPVIEEKKYLGLISEEALLDADENLKVNALHEDFLPVGAPEDEHLFVAAAQVIGRHLSILPVVNSEGQYLGGVKAGLLLEQTVLHCGIMDDGALIVMETDIHDFSISEISRLVETNDASVRHLNTTTNAAAGTILITMRINKGEVSDIVATFQRYDYRVLYFTGNEHYENELRRNYNHLINFLSI